MKIKNIILTIILLALIALIAGLNLGVGRAAVLQLNLNNPRLDAALTTAPECLVALDDLENKTLFLDPLTGQSALQDRVLELTAVDSLDVPANFLSS